MIIFFLAYFFVCVSDIYSAVVLFDRSGLAQGKSYFFTSDRRIIKNFIAEAINSASHSNLFKD